EAFTRTSFYRDSRVRRSLLRGRRRGERSFREVSVYRMTLISGRGNHVSSEKPDVQGDEETDLAVSSGNHSITRVDLSHDSPQSRIAFKIGPSALPFLVRW